MYTRRMKNKKQAVTIRFSPEGRHLVRQLAATLGLTQTAVIEVAVRELAWREHRRLSAQKGPSHGTL